MRLVAKIIRWAIAVVLLGIALFGLGAFVSGNADSDMLFIALAALTAVVLTVLDSTPASERPRRGVINAFLFLPFVVISLIVSIVVRELSHIAFFIIGSSLLLFTLLLAWRRKSRVSLQRNEPPTP
jgi:hypothetical protein